MLRTYGAGDLQRDDSVTLEDQLKNPANFIHGRDLYLVRCVSCGGKRGRENRLTVAADGYCAWCEWGKK
jgi:mono/diheme cytochrome c family protein